MKEIDVGKGMVALVDDSDYEWLSQYNWHTVQSHNAVVYARKYQTPRPKRKQITMHRFIMQAQPHEDIDHKDGNGLNNTRANLRIATDSQNQANRHKLSLNKSGFRGVCFNSQSQKWQAGIKVNGHSYHLGLHLTKEAAALAYNQAAIKFFGEFANLNVIKEAA